MRPVAQGGSGLRARRRRIGVAKGHASRGPAGPAKPLPPGAAGPLTDAHGAVPAPTPSRRVEGSCPDDEMSGPDCRPDATRCARQPSPPAILRLRSPIAWRARCRDRAGPAPDSLQAIGHQRVEVVPVTTCGPAHRPMPSCQAPLRQDAASWGSLGRLRQPKSHSQVRCPGLCATRISSAAHKTKRAAVVRLSDPAKSRMIRS